MRPSISCWRDHSGGMSASRATPMPRGSRPSIAALTRSGARKASENRHVDLADAAALLSGDAGRASGPIGDEAVEPAAPAGNCRHQGGAGLGPDRTGMLGRHVAGQKKLAAARCRRLAPGDLQHPLPCPLRHLFLGKPDEQLFGLDLNAPDMGLDETEVIRRGSGLEVVAHCFYDQCLDLGGRYAPDRSGARGLALEEGGRQIVSISRATVADMGWAHAIAAIVEQTAG
jgi:hypothetical protein